MAVNDIPIKINLDDYGSVQTIGELKQQLKELKSAALEAGEGSAAFDAITRKAGELNDQLNRVNENIRLNTGSAIENATKGLTNIAAVGAGAFSTVQAAAALFGNESKDLEKTLIKLNAAMALASGLKSLAEAPDMIRDALSAVVSLTNATKLNTAVTWLAAAAQKALAFATGGVTLSMNALKTAIITTGIGALVIGLGIAIAKLNDYADAAEKAKKRQDDLNKSQEDFNKDYDENIARIAAAGGQLEDNVKILENQLRLLKLNDAPQDKILKKEKEIIDLRLKGAIEYIEYDKKTGNSILKTKEDQLKFDQWVKDQMRDSSNKQDEIDAFYRKKSKEDGDKNTKAALDNKKKEGEANKKLYEDLMKVQKEEFDMFMGLMRLRLKEEEGVAQAIIDKEQDLTKKIGEEIQKRQELFKSQTKDQLDAEKEGVEKKKEQFNDAVDASFSAAEDLTSGLSSLLAEQSQNRINAVDAETKAQVELYDKQIEVAKAAGQSTLDIEQQKADFLKKQDVKKQEIAKKEFERNKAFQVANAVVNTAAAVVGQLSVSPPSPANFIAAGAAAALGALQIATIMSQQYTGSLSGSGGGSMGGSSTSGSSGGGGSSFTAPQFFGLGNETNPFNNPNGGITLFLSEHDITQAQQNVLGYVGMTTVTLGQPENSNGPLGPL